MSLIFAIARSHLLRRRRQTLVSVLGVALGVGFFIGMAAMMQGFQRDFVARIIDTQPHIVMRDDFREPPPQPIFDVFPNAAVALIGAKPREEVRGIRNARAIVDTLTDMAGVHVAPTLSGQILIRYGSKDVSANVIGLVPEREKRVTNIEKDIVLGSLQALLTTNNGIILGEGVAKRAGATLDDLISVVSPEGVVLKMKVVGVFRTGITLPDNFDTYVLLKKAQILQDRPNVINRIRLKLDDVSQAREVAARVEQRFGYRTEAWEETNSNVLGIFVIQNGIMYSTVGAILVVACFGIFNIISTVIHEKTRDIAIMKSMGFRERDIRGIFVVEGLLVGGIGAVMGWIIGFAIIEVLGSIDFQIEGFVKTQGFILYRTPWHYVMAAGFAMPAAVLAAWLPARKAARVNPVDIVRGAA